MLFNFSIYRVLSYEDITSHIAAGDFFLGTAAANALFGHYGKIFVALAMAVAIFGALNGSVMVFPRTYYAMAKDGMFFPSFTKLHPKYHTPTRRHHCFDDRLLPADLCQQSGPDHLPGGVQRHDFQGPHLCIGHRSCARSIPT